MSTVELFFNGRKEIIEIIDTGGDIVKHLAKINQICPLIGSDIKLVEKLGKGASGIVFSVEFPGKGEKLYAAKKTNSTMYNIRFPTNKTYMERFNEVFKTAGDEMNVESSDFFDFNNIEDPNANPPPYKNLYYPEFLVDTCKTTKSFKRTDGNGLTDVPAGSLICKNSVTEIIMSLMVGEIARDESSINFIDTFYFATCSTPSMDKISQYTFMERIDTTLNKLVGDKNKGPVYGKAPKDKEIISIYLQVIHALAVMQNRYSIVHGDLHTDNVFIEKNTPDKKWKNELLDDVDTLEFKLDGQDSIYIPSIETTYIAKLGDWGLSVKYPTENNPIIIGDENVFDYGYNQGNGAGPWLPNFYSQAYDTAYFTARVHALLPRNDFIKRIVMWMIGYDPDKIPNPETEDKFTRIFAPITGYRPSIKNKVLTNELLHVTPLSILTNERLMGDYLKNPGGVTLEVARI